MLHLRSQNYFLMKDVDMHVISRRICLSLLLCGGVLLFPLPSQAQDGFTSSFNYESSTLPYNWATTAWTDCSGECNGGSQSRTVTCQDNAGNPAPSEAECSHTQKPELTRGCDLPDCQWVTGSCPSHVHSAGGGGCGGAGSIGGGSSGGQDCSDDKIGGVNQDQL